MPPECLIQFMTWLNFQEKEIALRGLMTAVNGYIMTEDDPRKALSEFINILQDFEESNKVEDYKIMVDKYLKRFE